MTAFVVDSSVALKWFVQEEHSDSAARLHTSGFQLHVPAFFDVEVGNVLWKKMRRGELTRADADAIIRLLPLLPLERHADAALLEAAFNIAATTGRTVYDSLYIALALQVGGPMITADRRLYNALSDGPCARSIAWVEDVLTS